MGGAAKARRMGGSVFDAAERVRRRVPREEFAERAPALRLALLEAQRALAGADFPVVVLFSGVDGAGKGEAIDLLNAWLDPRPIATNAYRPPSREERERPEFWRYWRDLPPRGHIGLFLSAWYSVPLVDRAYGRIGRAKLDERLRRIAVFERMLADDGALVLKFWMHLGRKAQERRLAALAKNPRRHPRITKQGWRNWRRYDGFVDAAERIVARTGARAAPWVVVDGREQRYRALAVLGTVREELEARLAGRPSPAVQRADALRTAADADAGPLVVAHADPADGAGEGADAEAAGAVHLPLAAHRPGPAATAGGSGDHAKSMKRLRNRLFHLADRYVQEGRSAVLVFEGQDASGKGGAIRRLVSALGARACRVHQVAAPSDEERSRHYLWRFWRRLPAAGRIVVFDRSWYGRVLVERVEGFAAEDEWRRAYAEIRDFEEQLIGHGLLLLKFWLDIDRDEQERRFIERRENPLKRWKLTDEDWRNRARWEDYEAAVRDMVARTSTRTAPWTLVAANRKPEARLAVLRTVSRALAARLDQAPGGKR